MLDEPVAGSGAVEPDDDVPRYGAGTCASAAASPFLWSPAVFEPAFPGRSSIARHSPVFAHQQPSGWKPNPDLNVAAALSFGEAR